MNQILFVEDKRNSGAPDTKKIILFFAITLIVFGIILSGQGVYAVYQNHKRQEEANIKANEATKIQLAQTEDGNVKIVIESETVLSELIYYWNSEAPQTIAANGQTTMQETIAIPTGENILTVKTIDVNGEGVTERGTFILNVERPTIELSVIGDKIKIMVESKTDLSYIMYQWNSDNAERIDMLTYEDKTKLEKEIEIPVGQNTLLVTAVDIYENKSEKSQEIKGVTKPKLSPIIQGNYIYFEVTADETIKQVDFEFNGQAYVIKSDVIGDSKLVKYKMELKKGMNYLKIKATTVSGITEENLWTYDKK